jgi:hypothetical protein
MGQIETRGTPMPAQITDYRNVSDENRSKRHKIAQAPETGAPGKTIALDYISEGYEPAGSAARYTKACYSIHWQEFGARHGKRFLADAKGEDDARAMFDRLTGQWLNVGFPR